MKNEVTILIAEDDDGHASLIMKNLQRAGIRNPIKRFKDGQDTLDYLLGSDEESVENGKPYLLLLDIRMPKVDGIEVLRTIKANENLKRVPVIMVTTTDDPREVKLCHELGCSTYVTKPIDYTQFVQAIQKLGLFLLVIEVPDVEI